MLWRDLPGTNAASLGTPPVRASGGSTFRRSCPGFAPPGRRRVRHVRIAAERARRGGLPIAGRRWRRRRQNIHGTSAAQSAISPVRHSHSRRAARALSIMAGELSIPVIAASGHLWAIASALLPGPQPRSTIRKGRETSTRAEEITTGTRTLIGELQILFRVPGGHAEAGLRARPARG